MIGAHELKLKEPVIGDKPAASNESVLIIQPRFSANDHEASTSKAKPRDTKYTQAKWCPPRLTKTKKRRLQRMRNQQKVEDEAEKWRDEYFDEIHPTPVKMWMRKEVDTTVPMDITIAPMPSEEENMSIVVSSTLPPILPSTDDIPESASALEDDEEQVGLRIRRPGKVWILTWCITYLLNSVL